MPEILAQATAGGVAVTTTEGVTFTAWSDGYAVGFRITREQDDRVEYLVLNPSSEHLRDDFDGRGDVFVYHSAGRAGDADLAADPLGDNTVCFIDLFTPETKEN